MKNSLFLAAKDLKLRLRDKSAIMFAFLAPLGLAAIITFAFGNEEGFHTVLAIVDNDKGEISTAFVKGVKDGLGDAATLEPVTSEADAKSMVDKGSLRSAIVIPEGFTRSIQEGTPIQLKVYKNAEAQISSAIAEGVAESFANEIEAGRLAVGTAATAAKRPVDVQALAEKASRERIPTRIVDGKVGANPTNSASYFGPAMAIFFLSFTVQFGPLGILAERSEGTLKRLLASPTSMSSILLGKALGAFILGMISLGVMAVVTTITLGANWGPPIGIAALGAATIVAFMAISAVGATITRTEEGAQAFVGVVMSLFALLGGNFIRITDAPPLMQKLSLGTPNGWAIRGFIDLATGGGLVSIKTPLVALAAIALGALLVVAAFGKRLVRQ